jgi:Ca2+-binding RTX toxin-like protein
VSGDNLTINGLPAQVTITDSEAVDHLTIDGGNGNDTINAGSVKAGSVQLELDGDAGNDTLTGGAGNDALYGGEDNDILRGGSGDDSVYGGNGNDNLDGGAGNDTILGGSGDDTITGGLGDDLIRYSSTLDGHDTINGFDGNATGGQDHVDFDPLFDILGVASADRAARVSITDHGGSVDIAVDADGNAANGFELVVATLKTVDVIGINDDVLVGTL